jgi:hypothetical protein
MRDRRIGAGVAVAAGAAAAYFGFLRRWHLTWGATAQEADGEVAGDELMPHADIVATRAVEIDASPAAIWPWLVQMGPGRGGAYTYAWIERRLGIDIHNSDRIVPELQDLRVGDEIAMPGYAMRVERLDPEQAMVIRSSNQAWVWSFELRPVNGHTRLISRNRFATAALPMKDKLAYPIIEPGSWVMERKMLLTIKQRAEHLAQTQTTEVAERITVRAQPGDVYEAVSDVRRMARWSPECFAVWAWSRRDGVPARFVGFNRRGARVWFTTCRVVAASPGEAFAFDVTTFGMPVARWSYLLAAVPEGTEVIEQWLDQRGRGARVLGRIFTGRVADNRPHANREGMRTTLARLKDGLETS